MITGVLAFTARRHAHIKRVGSGNPVFQVGHDFDDQTSILTCRKTFVGPLRVKPIGYRQLAAVPAGRWHRPE